MKIMLPLSSRFNCESETSVLPYRSTRYTNSDDHYMGVSDVAMLKWLYQDLYFFLIPGEELWTTSPSHMRTTFNSSPHTPVCHQYLIYNNLCLLCNAVQFREILCFRE
jgi:hypothetical protein